MSCRSDQRPAEARPSFGVGQPRLRYAVTFSVLPCVVLEELLELDASDETNDCTA